MPERQKVYLRDIRIGSYVSGLSVCRDGYSLSSSPVPGFETSEVLSRVNQQQPLTSTDGSYQSELLKTVFNIGLKRAEAKPLWITPNSIRYRKHNLPDKSGKEAMAQTRSDEYTLHRKFASLRTKDVKAALTFANEYGLLNRHGAYKLIFRDSDTGNQSQIGESWLWWQEEISELAACLKLWDMVSSDHKELRNIVLWHRDGIALRLNDSYIQLVGRRNMNLLTLWHKGDLKGPALYYISLEMDRHLNNTLTPKMYTPTNEIYLFPDSLLSTIWLMLLLEISGFTRLLRCGICGEYFNTQDPRTRFCSTRCRMRNYRKRIARKSKRQR